MKVVIKKMNKSLLKQWVISTEINAGKKLKHTGIAKFFGNFEEDGFAFLVFEYVEGLDLFDYLELCSFQPLPEKRVRNIFRQIIDVVSFIHKKGFVHRDLKLENIMLMKDDTIKIIDFGLSAEVPCTQIGNAFVGSIEYVCPEIIQRIAYVNCKSEAFSLGVILFALLFGQFPFSTEDRHQDKCALLFPEDIEVSKEVKDLLTNMLVLNPSKRYTVEDSRKHKWLKMK